MDFSGEFQSFRWAIQAGQTRADNTWRRGGTLAWQSEQTEVHFAGEVRRGVAVATGVSIVSDVERLA